jgi:hypothetical protein
MSGSMRAIDGQAPLEVVYELNGSVRRRLPQRTGKRSLHQPTRPLVQELDHWLE